MRNTTAIVAALGLFGVTSLTPVTAGSAANADRPGEFKVAQSQQTVGTASSKKKSKKKPKPTKKQRYERSN